MTVITYEEKIYPVDRCNLLAFYETLRKRRTCHASHDSGVIRGPLSGFVRFVFSSSCPGLAKLTRTDA